MNDCLSRARAPCAARRPLSTIHHGITRMDDYAWLRAANWQAVMRDPAQLDPAIRAHLEAENTYAEAFMADTKDLQALRIAGVAHSPDHSLIAYAVDTKGSEFYTVNVIEADSARWCILASPTTMDRSNGRPTAVRFSMFGLMKTTVHAVCCGTQLAPTGPMISSMRRMMPVSFWV